MSTLLRPAPRVFRREQAAPVIVAGRRFMPTLQNRLWEFAADSGSLAWTYIGSAVQLLATLYVPPADRPIYVPTKKYKVFLTPSNAAYALRSDVLLTYSAVFDEEDPPGSQGYQGLRFDSQINFRRAGVFIGSAYGPSVEHWQYDSNWHPGDPVTVFGGGLNGQVVYKNFDTGGTAGNGDDGSPIDELQLQIDLSGGAGGRLSHNHGVIQCVLTNAEIWAREIT